MTPIEAALKVYDNTIIGTSETHLRQIITAFLDAAARDNRTCNDVFWAFVAKALPATHKAILELKEAVNG
jgi:hypothetical protein